VYSEKIIEYIQQTIKEPKINYDQLLAWRAASKVIAFDVNGKFIFPEEQIENNQPKPIVPEIIALLDRADLHGDKRAQWWLKENPVLKETPLQALKENRATALIEAAKIEL
jgi:hypothetical protein